MRPTLTHSKDETTTIHDANATQVGTNWPLLWASLLAVLVSTAACGQSSHSPSSDEPVSVTSGGSGGDGGTSSSSSASTGMGASTSFGATTSPAAGGSGAASAGGTSAGGSGGASAGGTSTGGGASTGGAGGAAECDIVNDECPSPSFCAAVAQNDEGPVYGCTSFCQNDEECEEGDECYAPDSGGGAKYCGPARPECEPTAAEGECTCDTVSTAVLVRGTGNDCEVVSADASACYWQYGTCLDACIREYYRYELGDGTALIVEALQGEMPPGWVSEGQGEAPESCPALQAEEL